MSHPVPRIVRSIEVIHDYRQGLYSLEEFIRALRLPPDDQETPDLIHRHAQATGQERAELFTQLTRRLIPSIWRTEKVMNKPVSADELFPVLAFWFGRNRSKEAKEAADNLVSPDKRETLGLIEQFLEQFPYDREGQADLARQIAERLGPGVHEMIEEFYA